MAKMILQQHLSGQTLADSILQCLHDPEALGQVWKNLSPVAEKSAAARIVELCLTLAQQRQPRA